MADDGNKDGDSGAPNSWDSASQCLAELRYELARVPREKWKNVVLKKLKPFSTRQRTVLFDAIMLMAHADEQLHVGTRAHAEHDKTDVSFTNEGLKAKGLTSKDAASVLKDHTRANVGEASVAGPIGEQAADVMGKMLAAPKREGLGGEAKKELAKAPVAIGVALVVALASAWLIRAEACGPKPNQGTSTTSSPTPQPPPAGSPGHQAAPGLPSATTSATTQP